MKNRVALSALHQPLLHNLLVRMGHLQHVVVQRDHGNRDVAAEPRHARRAADDNMRPSRGAAAAQLGERLEHGVHAFLADLRVVEGEFGVDEGPADS